MSDGPFCRANIKWSEPDQCATIHLVGFGTIATIYSRSGSRNLRYTREQVIEIAAALIAGLSALPMPMPSRS